jgi:hypothetical protein
MTSTDIISIDRLVADMRATFPKLRVRRRDASFRSPGFELVWMIAGDDEVVMPDGQRMLDDCPDDDQYRFGVHVAFDAWLALRGWYLERHDEFWFVPAELPTDEELAQWAAERKEYEWATQGPPIPDHLNIPF